MRPNETAATRSVYEFIVPPYRLLLTGYFNETPGYAVRRPRGTDDWLLVLTAGGAGRFGYEGGAIRTKPGDLTLVRPGTPHDYRVAAGPPGWDLLWAHFHPRSHWLEWLDWPAVAPGLMQISLAGHAEYPKIEARFSAALRQREMGGPQGELLAMAALEEVLIWCHGANPHSAHSHLDPRIVQTMEHIRQRLGEPLTLADLAELASLSPSRFGRLFRAETGLTPQQYIETRRIEAARELLDMTNRSVSAIAQAVGFESAFYFSLRFKRATGMSPSEYRQRLSLP
ncbi:MAG TPA: helix-turn-helix domain-containing protein [Capsulimonadaceae bacterium]|nr:helix-turn-helix domain-containing protein [Capsulimonadaceae bacterium]